MNIIVVSLVLLVCVCNVAALTFTSPTFTEVSSYERFTVAWGNASGAVKINLGASVEKLPSPEQMGYLWTIDTQLAGDNFTWIVPETLPGKFFCLELRDQKENVFSPIFSLRVVKWNTTSSVGPNATTSTPTPPETTSSNETTPLPTSTQSSPPTTLPQSKVEGGGLTTGAKVGIAVGASVGSLAILGVLFLAFRYRKKSAGENTDNRAELGDTGLLEAEGSLPTSGEEKKATKLVEAEERKRASTFEGKK